jgi:hypothetical protein
MRIEQRIHDARKKEVAVLDHRMDHGLHNNAAKRLGIPAQKRKSNTANSPMPRYKDNFQSGDDQPRYRREASRRPTRGSGSHSDLPALPVMPEQVDASMEQPKDDDAPWTAAAYDDVLRRLEEAQREDMIEEAMEAAGCVSLPDVAYANELPSEVETAPQSSPPSPPLSLGAGASADHGSMGVPSTSGAGKAEAFEEASQEDLDGFEAIGEACLFADAAALALKASPPPSPPFSPRSSASRSGEVRVRVGLDHGPTPRHRIVNKMKTVAKNLVSKELAENTVRHGVDLNRQQVARRLRCFERLLVGQRGQMRVHSAELDHFARIVFPFACKRTRPYPRLTRTVPVYAID